MRPFRTRPFGVFKNVLMLSAKFAEQIVFEGSIRWVDPAPYHCQFYIFHCVHMFELINY